MSKEIKKSKVLLLASYCKGTQNKNCTDAKPCLDCLAMCNCFEVPYDALGEYKGTLDYLTNSQK